MLLDCARLRAEYDTVISELEAARNDGPTYTSGFYASVADSVFEACTHALAASGTSSPKLTVLPAPVGSGKTTFTLAFISALTRLGREDKDVPHGAVVLTEQITAADDCYRTLREFLEPTEVAIWTSDHDVNATEGARVKNPAARFATHDLQSYAVAVVTHAFYKGKNGYKARRVRRDGHLVDRALKIVDEQPNDVALHEATHADVAAVHQAALEHESIAELASGPLGALLDFTHQKMTGKATLEKPKDDAEAWLEAERKLDWFISEAAERCALELTAKCASAPKVFGVGKAIAAHQAYIRRFGPKGSAPIFVGYERDITLEPGMVLLDATADIDGLTQICDWREHATAPLAQYNRLEIAHTPAFTKGNLKKHLATHKNRKAYTEWMIKIIQANMVAGQQGLVVCKKMLVENQNVPNWPEADPRWSDPESYTRGYNWDIDGRKLAVTYWGGSGIGANYWKDADVVFLFDEFLLPTHVSIGKTQGLKGVTADEGPLGAMGRAINARSPEVRTVSEGNTLRYFKQLALRGNARAFDEQGVCGAQKLVCTGDFKRLAANVGRMFPGASLRTEHKASDQSQQRLVKLFATLQDTDKDTLSAKEISSALGVEWRKVSSKILKQPEFAEGLANVGWGYRSTKGRRGSYFERLSTTVPSASRPALAA